MVCNRQLRTSRKEALAFWRKIQKDNNWMTADKLAAMQELMKHHKKKMARMEARANGISSHGLLLMEQQWRVLRLGDCKATWIRKLSFIPTLQVGHFVKENLAKLRNVHERLVKAVRMRGG